MVGGLEIFRDRFADYADQYVLIGGTAASLTMEAAGIEFRATKDLDIVLHVEALTPAFGSAFWAFVKEGGYQIRQVGETSFPTFYRFQKPASAGFPAMLELFSRAPDLEPPIQDGGLTPIPFDEAVSSLSAILLDESYYNFIVAGRRVVNGLPWIAEDRLIPLKAVAWLELTKRKASGEESIDSKTIRKHINDVLRLSQLLTASTRISVDDKIQADLKQFIDLASDDMTLDPKALGLGSVSVRQILLRIGAAYSIKFDKSSREGK